MAFNILTISKVCMVVKGQHGFLKSGVLKVKMSNNTSFIKSWMEINERTDSCGLQSLFL